MEITTAYIINQVLDKCFVTSVDGRPGMTTKEGTLLAMLDDAEEVRDFIQHFYGPSWTDEETEQIIKEVMV